MILIGIRVQNNNQTLRHVLVEFYENEGCIGTVGKPIEGNCKERFIIPYSFTEEGEHPLIIKIFVFGRHNPVIGNATITVMLKIPQYAKILKHLQTKLFIQEYQFCSWY